METMKYFSERLKELREEKGMSQTELGDELGVSRSSISFYEKSERVPDIELLEKAATFFSVPVDYLLGRSNAKSTDNPKLKAVCDYTYIDMLNHIKSHVSKKELLAQLAEEATELAHAALKYRRALDDENPTPVSRSEAFKNLIEEIDDVALSLETLALKWRVEFDSSSRERKLKRWVERLKDARERVFEKP